MLAASVKLMYAPQPTPAAIAAFKDTTIVNVACGHNHVVALDDQKLAYSWGTPSCHSHSADTLNSVSMPIAGGTMGLVSHE